MTHRDDCPRRHNAEPPTRHDDCTCTSRDKPDDQVLADMDDAEMIRRPHLWPWGDRLPLKRHKLLGGIDHGLLLRVLADPHGDGELLLAEGVLANGQPQKGHDVTWQTYASPESIVAAGWTVD